MTGTKSLDRKPVKKQDTPKESYILCPACEAYFSILENYVSGRFHHRIREVAEQAHFPIGVERGLPFKTCMDVDPVIFRLFIYSLVWRCSITSVLPFQNFNLDPQEEELLRASLNNYNSSSKQNLLTEVAAKGMDFPIIPFVILTAEKFGDKTAHLMMTNPEVVNPYYFYLNEYFLCISFDATKMEEWGNMNNADRSPIKAGYIPLIEWKNIINIQNTRLREQGLRHLIQSGKLPFGYQP